MSASRLNSETSVLASAASIDVHDSCPPAEAAIVDNGIGEFNDAAAPLHEVAPLSCFARDANGVVIGGAVGRRWGCCCELQQLWVASEYRGRGVGTALVRAFEEHARTHGCSNFYLETFSFQAPDFYRSLGYLAVHEHQVYPHGIIKHLMVKRDGDCA